jgi:outer membrane protein, multidrug efflux system
VNVARRTGAALVVSLALLQGCALGPNYRRPELPLTPSFRDQPEQQASIADLPWWEVFDDAALQELVRESLANNRDLMVATARVEQARYIAGVTRSELFPSLGYDAAVSRGEDAFFGSPATDRGTQTDYLAVLNSFWEVDVWGRIRRASEAARAEMLATDAFRRGVVLSLVSGVAQAYFELRELDLELEIALRTVENFGETYRIFDRQFQGGVASRLDPLRAEAALAQAAAAIPDLERLIVAKENQLSVLVGRPPAEIPRGAALTDQSEPPEIPVGVPSVLLERRPDLLEAEQLLVASNAREGQAIANFFPVIGLTALYGSVSGDLASLLARGTGIWSLTADAAGPIFTFGRTWYFWRSTQADTDAARAAYEQRVLVALQEVSDALVAREKLAQVRVEQERAVEALTESLRVARTRYLGGLSTYLEVLDAQEQLFPAENALAQTRRDELIALVSLYRALGGGWQQETEPPKVPQPIAP